MVLSRDRKPLYLQIKDILKDRILHGVYPLGTNIPSETQLESEFGVSKITVRNAIKELAQEGYLEPSSGKGTKVLRNTSASKLSKMKRFTEVLVEEGNQIQKQLVQAKAENNEEGTELHRLFGRRCLLIERLYCLNGAPYIHYSHYLAPALEEIETPNSSLQSLYGMLEEQGISLDKFRDEFSVSAAPSPVAAKLHVREGTPLLKRVRYSYGENGNVVEYSIGYYNTEMHKYVVHYDV